MEEQSPSESGGTVEIDEKLSVSETMSCGSSGSRSSPVNRPPSSKGKDGTLLLSQKEREEKIRQFREQQEEERRRRLDELQHATVQAQKFREQLEDERRKKIEDLRLRELERRQGVEERKRMIWEAEQERKEAILRRNLEREARIEARRNAHRSNMSFAFGSSTPRTFDLDLAALGPARTQNTILFSAPSGKRTDGEVDSARRFSGADNLDRKPEDSIYYVEGVVEEAMNNQIQGANVELSPQVSVEVKNGVCVGAVSDAGGITDMSEYNSTAGGPKRTSQYHPYSSGCLVGSGAVVGDDPMSRSMISLSSASRARRKTDLMPALPREHLTSRSRSPGNHGKRAVSMTRLDLLAQPRRKHTGVSLGTNNTSPVDGPRITSPSMSKSMHNIPNSIASSRSNQSTVPPGSKGSNAMSKSMLHLAGPTHCINKSSYPSARTPSPSQPISNRNLSKSMTHLAITPRPTRASQLRADARSTVGKEGQAPSTLMFNRSAGSDSGRLALSALSSKDVPSRPRSSMSATSEQSVTSSHVSTTSVKMRSGPRRARPVSMGGVPSNSAFVPQTQMRQGRSTERKAVTPTTRHHRAKSAEQSENKPAVPMIRKPAANKMPLKVAYSSNNISAKADGSESPQAKTPDQSLSPEPEVLETTDRQSPETTEQISADNIPEASPVTKPRISSEEEAKAALAEKRRLAREQAEREAELERQRQEELRRQEEERKRQEEEAQRKFEEEQIRLAELHRLQEEEKLKKAIEEQKQREEEERERLEEEAKLRLEKEEQERKAKEEAERQRKELEERLKREEAERAERKRRVEQIMSRTRKSGSTPTHASSQGNSKLSSPEEEQKPLPASSQETTADHLVEVASESEAALSAQSSIPCKDVDGFVPITNKSPTVNGQDYLQDDLKNWNPFLEQSHKQETNPFLHEYPCSTEETVKEHSSQNLNPAECLLKASDSGVILADQSPDKIKMDNVLQPNGYNHHDEDRSFTDSMSPEEKSENSVGILLDFGTISTPSPSQNFTQQIVSTEFDELIDIGAGTTNQKEVNLLNNANETNSNKVPGNPFIAFEEPITRKQDNSLTDLLS